MNKRTAIQTILMICVVGFLIAPEPSHAWSPVKRTQDFCKATIRGVKVAAVKTKVKSSMAKLKMKRSWMSFKKMFQKKGTGKGSQGGNNKADEAKYPDMQTTYQAHNKNSEGQGNKNERQVIASVNDPHALYFAQTRFAIVEPDSGTWSTANVTSKKIIGPLGHPEAVLTLQLHPIGKPGEISPGLVPYGTEPVGVGGGEMWRDRTGNYNFRTNEKQITVELGIRKPTTLTLTERLHFTEERKIQLSEWPDWLQVKIKELQALRSARKISTTDIVNALHEAITSKQYSVDETNHEGAFETAKCGKYQCDGSIAIASSVMRAHFKIPNQPITGFVGVDDPELPNHSVVVSPADGHAWMEYYDDESGYWEIKDFTPKNPDREKKEQEAKDRFKQKNQQEKQQKQEEKKDEKENSQTQKARPFQEVPMGIERDQWAKDWLAQILKDPGSVQRVRQQLEELKNGLTDAPITPLQKAELLKMIHKMEMALAEVRQNPRSTDEFIKNLKSARSEAGVTRNILPDLIYIEKSLATVQQIEGLTPAETKTLGEIRDLKSKMLTTDVKANESLAYAFIEMLEGGAIAPAIVRNKYTNPHTFKLDMNSLAEDLARGDRVLLQLANMQKAQKYLNLWTIPIEKPRIQLKDREQVAVGDIVEITVARDFPDPSSIIWSGGTTPQNLFDQFKRGDLLVREEYIQPSEERGREKKKPKAISIIMFDATGSMNSNNAGRGRNILSAAYIDRAQRLTAMGKEDHEIYQFPFGEQAHQATKVDNLKGAIDLVVSNLEYDSALHEGTEFTAPLVGAFALAEKINEEDQSVVRVSILLLTDTDGGVNIPQVETARNRLSQKIEVVINLISIGDHQNESLKKLAAASTKDRGDIGKVSYVPIPLPEVDELVATPEILVDQSEKHDMSRMAPVTNEWLQKVDDLLAKSSLSETQRSQSDPRTTQLYAKLSDRSRSKVEGAVYNPVVTKFVEAVVPRAHALDRDQKLSILFNFIEAEAARTNTSVNGVIDQLPNNNLLTLIHWVDGV
jgi:hypothetical protein